MTTGGASGGGLRRDVSLVDELKQLLNAARPALAAAPAADGAAADVAQLSV